jgi:hypothetical protein
MCGTSDRGYFDLYVNPYWEPCYGRSSFTVSISPNPTHGELNVTIGAEKPGVKASGRNADIEMILYDFYTRNVIRRWTFKSGQNTFRLNASNVKKGAYVLQVKKGDQTEVTKVMIN